MGWIIERLKEPSTYAGFASLAAALGISGELYTTASAALVGVFGFVALILREKQAA